MFKFRRNHLFALHDWLLMALPGVTERIIVPELGECCFNPLLPLHKTVHVFIPGSAESDIPFVATVGVSVVGTVVS